MKKKSKKVVSEEGIEYTVSDEVKGYSKDPFLIKKAEESKNYLKKAGFPQLPPPRKK